MRTASIWVAATVSVWSVPAAVPTQALPTMLAPIQDSAEPVRAESVRITSRSILIGRSSSSLRLELSDGSGIDIGFSNGDWEVNGLAMGSTPVDGPLHTSWTELIALTAELSASEVSDLLSSWEPPEELSDEAASIARNIWLAIVDTPLGPSAGSATNGRQAQVVGESVNRSLPAAPAASSPLEGSVGMAGPEETEASLTEYHTPSVELTRTGQESSEGGGQITSSLRAIGTGVGNLFEAAVAVIALTLLGLATQALVPRRMQLVSEVVRGMPARSGSVGFMSSMLFLPAWLLGTLALVISVVGILAAPLWLVGFPIAAVAVTAVGGLAVARNLGEWLAGSGYPFTERLRESNYLHTGFAGIVFLVLGPTAAAILSLIPGLGLLAVATGLVAWAMIVVAGCIGIGAVVLTKGGSRYPLSWGHADPEWHLAQELETDVNVGPTGSAGEPASRAMGADYGR